MYKDDNDIKIFTSKKAAPADQDILSMVEAMNEQRRNGNTKKAEMLGYALATVALSDETKAELTDPCFFEAETYDQVGVLQLFSAEAALNYFLPSSQLSVLAITALHKRLDELESDFYKNVVESSAYSFYYLSVRKGGEDVATDIGKTFAMLCKNEGNELYINQGRHIYNMVLHEVEKEVKNLDFQ